MLDPPLSPPSAPEEICWCTCPGRGGEQWLNNFLIDFLAISGDSRVFLFLFLKKWPEKSSQRRKKKEKKKKHLIVDT
jgi:hypothetical protein